MIGPGARSPCAATSSASNAGRRRRAPPGTEPEAPRENTGRHGYDGWLRVTRANPAIGRREQQWLEVLDAMDRSSVEEFGERTDGMEAPLDPDDWRVVSGSLEGMAFVPVSVDHGRRNGARERVLAPLNGTDGRLTMRLGALATRVLFDGDRAVGVEYLRGSHLYRADPGADEMTAAGTSKPSSTASSSRDA